MNLQEFKKYCLAKKGVQETYPFDAHTLVFKVAGKMFALTGRNNFVSINLKAEPERALDLRIRHGEIQPGYHMNKRHWNTVSVEGSLKDDFIYQLIDESYDLVVAGMTRKQRVELGAEEHPTVTKQKVVAKKKKIQKKTGQAKAASKKKVTKKKANKKKTIKKKTVKKKATASPKKPATKKAPAAKKKLVVGKAPGASRVRR